MPHDPPGQGWLSNWALKPVAPNLHVGIYTSKVAGFIPLTDGWVLSLESKQRNSIGPQADVFQGLALEDLMAPLGLLAANDDQLGGAW